MKKSKIFLIVTVVAGAFVMGLIVQGLDFSPKSKVAVIPIQGTIYPGAGQASPSVINDLVERAEDEGAEAFLFEINSPGGTVVASRQIERVIDGIEKPTVCQFQDVAASGAYWAGSACDHIVSDPLSMTGSIGVTSSYLEYSEYMEEEGIKYVRLVKGELKDMGSPYRNLTERERKLFNESLQKVYSVFLNDIKENRNLSESQMEDITSGRTFLGSEAKKKGMVDYLGGRKTVKEILEERLNREINFEKYRKKVDVFNFLDILGKDSEKMKSKTSGEIYSLERNVPSLMAIDH